MIYFSLLILLLSEADSFAEHSVVGPMMMIRPLALAAIVGEDDRREWFQVEDGKLKDLGRSTAVMIEKKDGLLEKTADGFRLAAKTKTHQEQDNLCPGETFADQPTPGSCTSSLVASDVVATAAHCLVGECKGVQFVFDFLKKNQGSVNTTFDESQVFECDRVLESDAVADWALIKLDRPVGRTPFVVRSAGQPKLGDPLTVLGFPRGLPLKIAGGAKVEENQNSDAEHYLETNLDTFGGNSGSPVVNSETKELEGIFTVGFGEFDEETDPQTGKVCNRLARRTEAEATPGWVSRASGFRNAVAKITR